MHVFSMSASSGSSYISLHDWISDSYSSRQSDLQPAMDRRFTPNISREKIKMPITHFFRIFLTTLLKSQNLYILNFCARFRNDRNFPERVINDIKEKGFVNTEGWLNWRFQLPAFIWSSVGLRGWSFFNHFSVQNLPSCGVSSSPSLAGEALLKLCPSFLLTSPKPPHSLQTSNPFELVSNLPLPLQRGQKIMLYFSGLNIFPMVLLPPFPVLCIAANSG